MDDYARENFGIQCSLLRMELEVMLEKTKKIEEIVREEIRREEIQTNPCSDVDFYRPDEETKSYEPPKKRMKRN